MCKVTEETKFAQYLGGFSRRSKFSLKKNTREIFMVAGREFSTLTAAQQVANGEKIQKKRVYIG